LIFAGMPSFVGIYSFFQPETLLLIALGLTLWLHQLFLEKPGAVTSLMLGLLWGLNLSIRITVLPLAAVCWLWSWFKLSRSVGTSRLLTLLVLQGVATSAVYSIVPLKLWQQLKVIELVPGMVNCNRCLYESGAEILLVNVKLKGGKTTWFTFSSPATAEEQL